MRRLAGIGLLLLTFSFVVSACAGPSTPASEQGRASEPARTGTPKRIVAAIRGTTPILYRKIAVGASYSGLAYVERLVNAGLVTVDTQGALQPQLAEAVPTLDNGLWKLFPDGRMETTWKIKPNAQWHDGTAFTAADVLFTARVEQDKSIGWNYNPAYDAVDSVTAPDAATVLITWKQPYIEADLMFAPTPAGENNRGLPLPRHILEKAFDEDRANFLNLPYWGPELVATGPFKVREMVADQHLLLTANDQYVLGRPRIDEIEVKFIPDSNTLIANILAGEIDVTIDERAVSFEEARNLKEQWTGGRIELGQGGVPGVQAQFLTPRPTVVGDVRFRKALMYAIDRQEMVDTIQGGLAAVAHSLVGPDMMEWPYVEQSIVRYEFDPRRAMSMIEELGYSKGPDGFYRDAAGERLNVEIRATVTVINQKSMLSVADYWQRIGVGVDQVTIPIQRQAELEYMVTFPGFLLLRGPRTVTGFQNQHGSRAALPEKNFNGINRSRYMNAEFDALQDRYFTTIPFPERMQVLAQILHHESDQLPTMRLFTDPEPTPVSNRLKNVPPASPWNAHEWEVS
jgi:peptide/nickel transport system substrate-binding protein